MIMKSFHDAKEAIKDSQNAYLHGQKLIVRFANLPHNERFDAGMTTSGYTGSNLSANLMPGIEPQKRQPAEVVGTAKPGPPEGASRLAGEPGSMVVVRYIPTKPSVKNFGTSKPKNKTKGKKGSMSLQQQERDLAHKELSTNGSQIKQEVTAKLGDRRHYSSISLTRIERLARIMYVELRLANVNVYKQERSKGKTLTANRLNALKQEENLLDLLSELKRWMK